MTMRAVESSPVAPTHWDPVDTKNGTPGDADQLQALAKRYADTASEIETQVTHLKKLANESANFWKGAAAGTFTDKANDLASNIVKAQGRYEAAADAVNGFASELHDLQKAAYDAADAAQKAQSTMDTNHAGDKPTMSDPPTDAENAAKQTYDDKTKAYGKASGELKTAKGDYETAVSNYNTRAKHWAGVLNDGLDDGLKDGFWDRHFHFLQELAKWVGVAILVLVVVALIVATCGVGGIALLGSLTLAQALLYTTVALTAVQLIAHSILYATGHGSLKDVIIDAVSLATLGLGPALGQIARVTSEFGEGVAEGVSAARAGSSAFGKLGSVLYRLSDASSTFRSIVSSFDSGAAGLARGDAAAAEAIKSIQAIKAESTAIQRLSAFGEEGLSDAVAKLGALNDAVPGVLRLQGLQGIAKALSITNGTVNLGVVGVGVKAAIQTFTDGDEPVLEPEVKAEINEIAETWSQPFSHLGS